MNIVEAGPVVHIVPAVNENANIYIYIYIQILLTTVEWEEVVGHKWC